MNRLNAKAICLFAVMIALYVVLSTFLHIPTGIGNTWLDMGYVVYGLMLALYGLPALIIGVVGVLLENVLFAGWISYSWIAGQVVVGLICGAVFKHTDSKWLCVIVSAFACMLSIGIVKTAIEIWMGYGTWSIKLPMNGIISIIDCITLMFGYFIARTSMLQNAVKPFLSDS